VRSFFYLPWGPKWMRSLVLLFKEWPYLQLTVGGSAKETSFIPVGQKRTWGYQCRKSVPEGKGQPLFRSPGGAKTCGRKSPNC